MKKHYFLILYCLLNITVYSQYSWVVKDSFPASPRLFNTGFMVNGSGYQVGGVTSLSPFVVANDVWQYTPSSDNWVQKSNFPSTISASVCFVINDTAYYIGGSSSASVYVSTSYIYNPSSDTWTSIASFPENGVAEAFSFAINGIGYVGAGVRTGGSVSSTVHSYSPQANTWSSVANYPGTLNLNVSGFSIGSMGYAGLGQDGNGNFTNQFYQYNPATNTWSTIAQFPGKPRSGAMSFVLNGKAYVGGGVRDIAGTPYALNDFYQYDPGSNTWSAVPGLPGASRHNAAFFASDNEAYIVGGYNDDGNNYYNLVSEFGSCDNLAAGIPIVPGGSGTNARIEIYPNPSTNDVAVRINSAVTSEVKYEIISVDGKVIKTGSTNQSTFGFSANNFSDGVYILTITDNNGTHGAQRFEVIH